MIDRYFLEEMKNIWGEDNYYAKWIDVEAAVLKARNDNELSARLEQLKISPEEIREGEKTSGHELNSFLDIICSRLGEGSERIHAGLTSSDIMDTARILQMKESWNLILKELKVTRSIITAAAHRYKKIVLCGRTHGQFAEPVTVGLKFARFLKRADRNIERMKQAEDRILRGQISGAVGTYSLISPAEEKKILGILGLKPSLDSSQVIPRDIFAEYLFILSLISSMAEEIALEIRLLAQDGIKELSEPFISTQTGSSAMPHKKNPVICERICGLSRLVKGAVTTGLSNISLWNERDISHSSNERIKLEQSSSLTYYILVKLKFVIENINVHEENIAANIEKAGALLYSSGVLKVLLESGVPRVKAYGAVKKIFQGGDIDRNSVKKKILEKFSVTEEKLDEVMDIQYYLKDVEGIFGEMEIS